MRKAIFIFLIFFLTFFMFSKGNHLNLLKKRVNTYWESRVKDDLVTCYKMLSKASKEKISMTSFIRKSNLKVSQFEIEKIEFDRKNKSRATVYVLFSGYAMGFSMNKIRNKQFWVFENGNWFVEYKVGSIKRGFSGNGKSAGIPPQVKKNIENFMKTHKIAPPKIIAPERIKDEEKNNTHH